MVPRLSDPSQNDAQMIQIVVACLISAKKG